MNSARDAYYRKRYEEAINICSVIVTLDENQYEAWRILSSANRRQGKHQEALDAAEHLVGLTPREPLAWYIVGRRKSAMGELVEAQAAFEHALQLDNSLKSAKRALLGVSKALNLLDHTSVP